MKRGKENRTYPPSAYPIPPYIQLLHPHSRYQYHIVIVYVYEEAYALSGSEKGPTLSSTILHCSAVFVYDGDE